MVSCRRPIVFETFICSYFTTRNSPLEKTPHKARVVRDDRVTAMRTVIEMTAQRGGAAAPDSAQHLQMLIAEPGAVLFYETITVRAKYVGHL